MPGDGQTPSRPSTLSRHNPLAHRLQSTLGLLRQSDDVTPRRLTFSTTSITLKLIIIDQR